MGWGLTPSQDIYRVRDGLKHYFGKELGNLLLNSQGQMMDPEHGPEQGRRKAELDGGVPGPIQGCKQTLVVTSCRQTAF